MKTNQLIRHILDCFVILILLAAVGKAKVLDTDGVPEVIVIENPEMPRAEKEAILILPGLGDGRKGRKHQKRFFENQGFDLFIPDFHDRKSFDGSVENLEQFFESQNLREYKKLHIFPYLLGTWVLNTFLQEHGLGNIATIVYDRSPIQERAPRTVREKIPLVGKIIAGKQVIDMSYIPYPPIPHEGVKIGLVVESKSTFLMRFFKKTGLGYGPLRWDAESFQQTHDDLIYTRLDHKQMYYTFDEIGAEIVYFFREGRFPKEARREQFDWDPFKKYKKSLDS